MLGHWGRGLKNSEQCPEDALIAFPLSQGEKFKLVWLPYLARVKKFELFIPWWLENLALLLIYGSSTIYGTAFGT